MTPKQLRAQAGNLVGRAAPHAWQGSHSDYGPLASLEQATAAELGGIASAGRIIAWLKLWNALAFGLVIIALDRVLRSDPARRARAHLLWSLNPLLLWGLVASGHLDALAGRLRPARPAAGRSPWPRGRGPAPRPVPGRRAR